MKVILASGSPRRKELLANMGFEYEIHVSDCEENTYETEPTKVVEALSNMKAEDVMSKLPEDDYLLIAADTLVFLDKDRLGKPSSEENASEILHKLSGRSHVVITGVTVLKGNKEHYEKAVFSQITEVEIGKLSDREISDYIKTGEPMDKAGAYAIQGLFAKHVVGIKGDYSNVVGLPVSRLYEELKNRNWFKEA